MLNLKSYPDVCSLCHVLMQKDGMVHRNDAVKILHLKAAVKAGGRANSERKGPTQKIPHCEQSRGYHPLLQCP